MAQQDESTDSPSHVDQVIGLALFVFAAAVRLAVFGVSIEAPVFDKYPAAARLVASGSLHGARVLDFSPLYLDLHRIAFWLGMVDDDLLRTVQALGGAGLCVLIFVLGRHWLGRSAGVVAGVVACLSVDLIVYAHVLDAETLLVFLLLLTLLTVQHAVTRPSKVWPLLVGVLLGLCIATRPTSWLLLPIVALVAWRAIAADRRRLFGLLALAGVLAVTALFAVRARVLSQGSAEVMSPWQVIHGGNNPESDGYYRPLRLAKDLELEQQGGGPDSAHAIHRALGRAAGYAPREADHQWRDLSVAFAANHPRRFATILLYKLLGIGQPFDFHDNAFAVQLEQGLGTWPLLPTSWLLPLGAAGLLLRRRRLMPLLLLGAVQVLVCVVFYTSVRFRLPLLPALALGLGAWVDVVPELRGKRWRPLRALALAALLWTLFHHPWPPGAVETPSMELEQEANHAYQGAQLPLNQQRLASAAVAVAQSLYVAPWLSDKLPFPGLPLDLKTVSWSLLPRARVEALLAPDDPWRLYRLAILAEVAADPTDAQASWRDLAQHTSGPALERLRYQALLGQARAAHRLHDLPGAHRAYLEASGTLPAAIEALVGLANTSAEPERASWLQAALLVHPRFEVLYQQGRSLLDAGHAADALQPLDELSTRLPRYGRGRMLYAFALFGSGRLDDAVRQATMAQRQAPNLVDAVYRPGPIMLVAAQRSRQRGPWLRAAEFAEHDGDLAAALQAWQQVDRLQALDAPQSARVGWLLLRHEQASLARPWFQRALGLDPRQADALEGIARCSGT